MSRKKQFRWYRIANLMALGWLLSSCGSTDDGAFPLAASIRANPAVPAFAYVAGPNALTTYSVTTSGGMMAVARSPLTFPGAEPLVSRGIVEVATDRGRQRFRAGTV